MEIKETEVRTVKTKCNCPVSDYAVSPRVGSRRAGKYCYVSFMKRFTNHPEPDDLCHDICCKGDKGCFYHGRS